MAHFKYFIYNGQKLGQGTKVRFNYDLYDRNAAHNLFSGYKYFKMYPSIFRAVLYEDGKTSWHFHNCITDDLVPERDIEEIVLAIPYIEKTDKDRIQEKKEQGKTLEYILPGTIIYLFSMLFITIFNERLWGWIAATILYKNYCYEQLSK